MWAMTDSVLDLKPMKEIGRSIVATTPMFRIGDSIYTANAWVTYANTYRFRQDGTGAKPHAQVRDEFEQFALISYYRDHLEDFNSDFRDQMNEFRDGNMFFEIMQHEIWNPAQTDTVELKALYEKNRSKYLWEKSVDAILFFCADENTARIVQGEVKKDPLGWRKIVEKYSDKVVADSSRFEWEQIPNLSGTVTPKTGMVTEPFINESDKSASFAYIVQAYTKPMPRSYQEAKGMVINDYQTVLEERWNKTLREKYPVKINEQVLAEIISKKE
jgi:peptidyl-prolyl cis-trans isomerase SurA